MMKLQDSYTLFIDRLHKNDCRKALLQDFVDQILSQSLQIRIWEYFPCTHGNKNPEMANPQYRDAIPGLWRMYEKLLSSGTFHLRNDGTCPIYNLLPFLKRDLLAENTTFYVVGAIDHIGAGFLENVLDDPLGVVGIIDGKVAIVAQLINIPA